MFFIRLRYKITPKIRIYKILTYSSAFQELLSDNTKSRPILFGIFASETWQLAT